VLLLLSAKYNTKSALYVGM